MEFSLGVPALPGFCFALRFPLLPAPPPQGISVRPLHGPLPGKGWLGTWMSEGDTELIFRIGLLRISVSGPIEDCVTARRRILASLGPASPDHSPRSQSSFSVIDPPASAPEPARTSCTSGPSARRVSSRDDVLASFPPLPERWASQARSLHSTSVSGLGRITRAWVAGNWARATLDGRVPSPVHTPVLNLPAKLYVVLRAPGLQSPALVGSSAAYFDIVGRPFGQGTISHSFPSLLEVRVYCDAAGVTVPQKQ